MNSGYIERLETAPATESTTPKISQSLPTRKLDDWEQVLGELNTSVKPVRQTRAGFLTRLFIGLCTIGIGGIGVAALFQGQPLERYVQAYSALIILVGLLLVVFSLLNKNLNR